MSGCNLCSEPDEWPFESDSVTSSDIGATLYHAMGINPQSEVRDILDRPMYFNDGEVLTNLF